MLNTLAEYQDQQYIYIYINIYTCKNMYLGFFYLMPIEEISLHHML